MTDIKGFFGDYRYLSNFFEAPMVINSTSYQTVEHFFQASKANCQQDHDYVNSAPTPGVAKQRGRRLTLRTDWERVKLRVMRLGVKAKFEQNTELKKKLMETAGAYLEETNHWGDTFWGVSGGKGHNHLGEILMEYRDSEYMEQFYV